MGILLLIANLRVGGQRASWIQIIKRGVKMSFGDAFKSFFRNYSKFDGRARRSEYWFAVLGVSLISWVINLIALAVDGSGNVGVVTVISYIWALAILVPMLALVARRLHDVNKSFGYYFMGLIPIVGWILVLVQLVKDSQPGPNRFGESVK